MKFFDTYERTYQGYKDDDESSYAFLNRSAMPKFAVARDILEAWFANYPQAYQATLASNFTSDNYGPHFGSFFELYCYSLFQACGFYVQIEQIVDAAKGNPIDFLLGRLDHPDFCVESTVIADPELTVKRNQQLDILDTRLNQIQSNRRLVREVETSSKKQLPYKDIAAQVEHWLSTLNDASRTAPAAADDVDSDSEQAPSCTWDKDGWILRFEVLPGERVDDLVPIQFEGGWVGEHRLKKKLEQKAKQHPGIELPYVIAVDILDFKSMIHSGDSVADAVFGQEIVVIDRNTDTTAAVKRSPELPHRPDHEKGLWLGRSGKHPAARNRHVSALLLVNEVLPWSVVTQTPMLWHNPWASHPLSTDIWPGPQMIPNAKGEEFERLEGKTIAEILSQDQ